MTSATCSWRTSTATPRKLNLATGRCRTPCEPHKAIDPETGRCINISTLLTYDYNLYDDDEDDYMAENIKWTPTTSQTIANHKDKHLKDLIERSRLTVADLRTMRGIEQASVEQMWGHYSSGQRKQCDNSIFSQVLRITNLSKCGFRNVEAINTKNSYLHEKLQTAGEDFTFIFGYKLTPVVLNYIMAACKEHGQDVKLAVVDGNGVFRILYNGNADYPDPDEYPDFVPQISDEEFNTYNKSRQNLAKGLDDVFRNYASITYHAFDDQTKI